MLEVKMDKDIPAEGQKKLNGKSSVLLKQRISMVFKRSNPDAMDCLDDVEVKKRRLTFNESVVSGDEQVQVTSNGGPHFGSVSLKGITSTFGREWRKRKLTFSVRDQDGYSNNNKRRRLSFFKDKKIISKFLSNSVGKLNIPSSSASELYKKASDSFHSLTKLLELPRRRSLPENRSQASSDVIHGSSQSIGKASWPVPCLEAIFMPEFPNRTMITENDFILLNCIGRGAFGCVYRICLKKTPEVIFALKVQKKCDVLSYNVTSQVKNEASIQMSLCHCAFITKSFACWQSRTKLFTLMQCSTGYGDLYNLWQEFGPFNWPLVQIYAAEIAIALDYCHRRNVIYRDLKLENVTLAANGHVQITDFGFAKRLTDYDRTTTICGTLQYMAPEVAYGQPYGKYIDWWCFGVLLHVLYTGHYPYPNSEAQTHYQLRYDSYYSTNCIGLLHNLLQQLLNVNLAKRICSYEAVQDHLFFHRFDWSSAAARKLNPYMYINGIEQCEEYALTYEKTESDIDDEETWSAFDENYEYGGEEYFSEIV